jgi:hypothetical protein
LMLQWLAVSDIVSDLLCIDIAGIIASWGTPNPSRVETFSRAHVYWTLSALFRQLP